MEAVDVRGRFVWHQLMTRDVPGAKKFYSKLTGWKAMPWPLDPNYTVCHSDAGPVAGIMELPADVAADVVPFWMQYIGTRDVDATAEAAVRLGGSVVKSPEDMAGAGRYAMLKDPQGAVFAVIDPENARPEPAGSPPLGTFSWHELATSDNEAAFAFYNALFGWDAMTRMDMGPNGIYLIFGWNGQQRGGMYIKPSDMPSAPNWLPYIIVPSADEGFTTATGIGAREMMAPMDVPGGSRIAAFFDPTGAAVAIHSMPAMAAAESKSPSTAKAKTKKAKVKPAPKKAAAKKKPAKKVAAKKGKKAVGRKSAPKKKAPMKLKKKAAKKARSKK